MVLLLLLTLPTTWFCKCFPDPGGGLPVGIWPGTIQVSRSRSMPLFLHSFNICPTDQLCLVPHNCTTSYQPQHPLPACTPAGPAPQRQAKESTNHQAALHVQIQISAHQPESRNNKARRNCPPPTLVVSGAHLA